MVCCIGFGATAVPAAAETNTEAVLKQKLRVLEARLDFLDGRLKDFEKREALKHQKDGSAQKGGSEPGRSTRELQTSEHTTSGSTENPTPASNAPDKKTASTSKQSDDSIAQETFLFRDMSPTLKKGQWELSQEADYIRSNGFLMQDRVFMGVSTVRYGLTDRFELAVAAPYYHSSRTTQTYGGSTENIVQSSGDMTATASYALQLQSEEKPGLSVTASVIKATGVNPYVWDSFDPATGTGNAYQPGTNPIDPLRTIQSKGQYGVRGTILAYKVYDPIVVFGSIGLEYYFPKTYLDAYTIEGGYRTLLSTGINFSLSEKVSLGMAVSAAYSPNMWINNASVAHTFQEQYVARVVATLQIADNLFLEPAVGWGLTSDSPSMQLGITLRKRFDPPNEESEKKK